MKNKYFSLKLYIETMRQLRLPAWIITGIICVITATTDFIIAIDGGYGERLPSIMEFAPGLWGFMYIAPLVFTIMSFGFLNSRSDSDFYHSLPNTRQSLYISRIAAVMTMTFGGILSTCIVSLLGRLIWQLPINMMSYFYIILFSTAASMVITGGVALAMSITGTKLSNAVATLLIVYFPRCILFILAAFMENVAPVLVTSSMGMLFSFRYNLAFAPIGLLEMGEDIMTFWPGILYSIVLSVIYAALGLWAFVRRRSETADKAAPSKKLHRVYAIALATPLALLATNTIVDTNNWDYDTFSLIVVLAVLDFIIYMVYEMMTIKNFKKAFKALPAFVLLFVACVGVSIGTRALAVSSMNNIPEKDQVKGIRVSDTSGIFSDMYLGTPTYNQLLQERALLTNSDLIDVTVKVLRRDVKSIKDGAHTGYSDLVVEFVLENGRTITRQINISAQMDEYKKYLLADTAYQEATSAYPSADEIKSLVVGRFDSDELMESLLPVFLNELESMTDEERLEYFGRYRYDTFEYLSVRGYLYTEAFGDTYNLDMYVPKTTQKFMDMSYEKDKADIDKLLKGYLDGTTEKHKRLNITWYEISGKEITTLENMHYNNYEEEYYYDDKYYDESTTYAPEDIETIAYAANLLLNTNLQKADVSKDNIVVSVSISGFDYLMDEYTIDTIWIQSTEELNQLYLDLQELRAQRNSMY